MVNLYFQVVPALVNFQLEAPGRKRDHRKLS